MERPSHILFARHSSLSRAPLVGLAIGLQFVGFWLFTQGLVGHIPKLLPTPPIDVRVDPNEIPPTPPPPLPPETRIEIPTAPIPTIPADPGSSQNAITATTSTPPQNTAQPKPLGVDRAAVGITATHTVPPYPPVEQRLGIEGIVTLRLTVGTEGQVTAAEIVKSAGREALDQAARAWIIGHWRYRPALKDGNPAVTQVLASVSYSLKNQP
ncbi:MAG: energy transducer TonB [Rhizomicrobium sp.]